MYLRLLQNKHHTQHLVPLIGVQHSHNLQDSSDWYLFFTTEHDMVWNHQDNQTNGSLDGTPKNHEFIGNGSTAESLPTPEIQCWGNGKVKRSLFSLPKWAMACYGSPHWPSSARRPCWVLPQLLGQVPAKRDAVLRHGGWGPAIETWGSYRILKGMVFWGFQRVRHVRHVHTPCCNFWMFAVF